MKRFEAVCVLQYILMNFSGRTFHSFGLIREDKNVAEEPSYKVFIEGNLNDESVQNILSLVRAYGTTNA